MSKTDKTDPAWVKHARDGRPRHDHATGDCRPDSLAAARRRHAGLPGHAHRSGACPAYEWVVLDCEAARCYTAWAAARAWRLPGMPAPAPCDRVHRRLTPTGVRCPVCDVADDDWHVCENRIDLGNYIRSLKLYGAVAPGWYVRDRATKPRRHAGKHAARTARREWNAGYRPGDENQPDLEDGWEPQLEGKSVARWYW